MSLLSLPFILTPNKTQKETKQETKLESTTETNKETVKETNKEIQKETVKESTQETEQETVVESKETQKETVKETTKEQPRETQKEETIKETNNKKVKVTYDYETKIEKIPYKTIRRHNIPNAKTRVKQNSVNGKTINTYKITFENGKEVRRNITDTKTIKDQG